MKIKELKPNQPNVEIEGVVKSLGEEKSFDKGGRELRLVKAVIEDDSGQIELTLWNEDIDKISEGDKIRMTDGYVKEYQGEKQLTTGRNGEIEVLDSNGSKGEGSSGSDEEGGEEDSGDDGKIEPEVEKI